MTKPILNALTRAWGLKAGLLFFTLLMTAFPSGATGETVKSQIAAGSYHTLAIKSDGTLWAWGYNYSGQLGDGTTSNKTTPVQIGTGTNWSQIAAGGYHTLAIKSDGTLWAWGYNSYGQLGDGASGGGNYKTTPVQIGTGTNWSQIAAGGYHTLAIKSDGTLWAWGNYYGQLGDATAWKETPQYIMNMGVALPPK